MQGGDFPIQDWLRRTLQYPSLVLTDFRKGGTRSRPHIHFQVENLVMADAVVRYRHRLKRSASEEKFAIFDVLSPEERDLHSKLFPAFLEAIQAGKKAQFNRAYLRVDGVPVTL
jgi:hypothetical protein